MRMQTIEQIIYGRHPVADALRAGIALDKVVLLQGTRGEVEKEMRHLCKEHQVLLQYLPKEKLDKLVRGNHQGVVAFRSLVTYHTIENVIPFLMEQGKVPLILVFDGVTDVRNFGAIARTAEAAGVHALVVSASGAAPINADAMKTSAGALASLPVCRVTSLHVAIEALQSSGLQVLASSLRATHFLHHLDLTLPTAFIIGSEDVGVQASLLRIADRQFKIPMLGTTDSYNVSVAAGMMLYETMCQRMG